MYQGQISVGVSYNGEEYKCVIADTEGESGEFVGKGYTKKAALKNAAYEWAWGNNVLPRGETHQNIDNWAENHANQIPWPPL